MSDNTTGEKRSVPAEVERAWFTIARFVRIPAETAARQLGVIGLANVALVNGDALDALREAVKGCGEQFDLDVRMESDVCEETNRHCVPCKQAMWKAISQLLGVTP